MAFYDRGTRYDSGARYDQQPPTPKRTRMAQVKLELDRRSDDELHQFAETHIAQMAGNASFPTPTPTAAAFQAIYDDYCAKLTASEQAEQAAREATQLKDSARVAISQALNDRGNYVQSASGGEQGSGVSLQGSGVSLKGLGSVCENCSLLTA